MNERQISKLADRLVDVAIEADQSNDLGGCSITRKEVKAAVAREVARQMLWARASIGENDPEIELTVAPTDWNP